MTMRTFWTLLAGLGVLMVASTGIPQDKAVPVGAVSNGGFEEPGPEGFPRDWMRVESAGKGGAKVFVEVTNDAHSGKNAMRIKMEGEGVETGINRVYKAGEGQGAMLNVLKGGMEFWYKALSCGGGKMALNVIPMKANGLEGGTGARRSTYTIPDSQVGDGKWHRVALKYDFTAFPDVKFAQIGPRISHGSGEMVLDDIRWVEKAGPMLTARRTWITETKGKEGREVTLQFTVKNDGDETAEAKGEIVVPPYLSAEAIADSATIKPDDWQDFSWRIIGERDKADAIRFTAKARDAVAEAQVELKPQLDPPTVAFSKFIVEEGAEFDFTCTVHNSGTANAKDTLILIAPSDEIGPVGNEALQTTADVPAGGYASATWRLKALKEGWNGDVRARVMFGDVNQDVRSVKLVAGAKPEDKTNAIVGNDRVRIVFPKNSFGYGIGFIEVKEMLGWRQVGAIPRLARLAWQPAEGVRRDQPIYAGAPEVTKDGDKIIAAFKKQLTDADGNQWTVAVRFALGADAEDFDVESSATCNKDLKLLCFEGPMVYAGEGAFGAEKTEAIFPGLEWLEGEEYSSSTLDITTPQHVRYVPHPNRVTIPCMGVLDKKTLVGILWDAKHKWDGVNDRMSAVFASPNYFEGTSSHLMGLFAPSVPDWVKENEREAATPYALKAGQAITLKMHILAQKEAKDALAVMDRWFQLYPIIEPMPNPRGSAEQEINFSMQTYFKPLWVPEEQKWYPYLGGPRINYKPVVPSPFVHDLLTAAQVVKDAAAQKQYRDRVALVLPNLRGGGDDRLCFFLGDVEARWKGMQAHAVELIRSQGPEGEWRFNANRRDQGVFKGYDYRELGPDKAAELGTCAASAKYLMRCARITGNKEALDAGLKALRFMERFRVPRAAQVWEVPVHVPDILAASYAADGDMDAYRLTGDKHWLDEARRQARAGLPFLYFWNDDRFDFMRYASIPVFGATWFKGNWMGRPVQWCGLDHAYAMLCLSELDPGFPWRKVGEGVTISGMYQQSTDEKDIGMWPDSVSAIDAKKSGWIFSPNRITQNVYWTRGRDFEPYTTFVATEGGIVHVSSPARMTVTSEPKDADRTLELASEFAPPDPYYILIMPVARPERVALDGKDLPVAPELEKSGKSAMRYTPASGMLVVKVVKPGRVVVSVGPLRRIEAPLAARLAKEINFQFNQDGDDEGWTSAHDVEPITVAKGMASFKITGGDPYIVRANLDVDAAKAKTIVVRMRVTGGAAGQIYWSTKESPSIGEDKDVRFEVKADGQFHEYRVNMAAHPLWTGTVTSLRLDPVNGKEAIGADVEIDYMRAE